MLHGFVHLPALGVSGIVAAPTVALAAPREFVDEIQLLDHVVVHNLKTRALARSASTTHTWCTPSSAAASGFKWNLWLRSRFVLGNCAGTSNSRQNPRLLQANIALALPPFPRRASAMPLMRSRSARAQPFLPFFSASRSALRTRSLSWIESSRCDLFSGVAGW